MKRRKFLKQMAAGGLFAGAAASPAVAQSHPSIRWRLLNRIGQRSARSRTMQPTPAARPPVTPERIMQMSFAYAPPLMLEAAVRHKVFDVLDGGPHCVQSDATPGKVRNLRHRRETGREYQISDLLIGESRQSIAGEQSSFASPQPDHCGIDPSSIIDDLYDKSIALPRCLHGKRRSVRLFSGPALFARFNSVIDRISHQMQ